MKPQDTHAMIPADNMSFIAQADLELKRAERYRIFVSLIVLDLSLVCKHLPRACEVTLKEILDLAASRLRCTDTVTLLDNSRVALLFPETPRQNAMIAGQRITELVRRNLSDRVSEHIEETVPMETASYPDAAGAKPVKSFLEELASKSRN